MLDGEKIGDYCDGEIFQNHPLFKEDPCALQICLYYDDLEICNALGSKTKKHKLGELSSAIQQSYITLVVRSLIYRSVLLYPWEYRSKVPIISPYNTVVDCYKKCAYYKVWN